MRESHRTTTAGIVVLAGYAVHATFHLWRGEPQDLLWVCHVAAAMVGIGLIARNAGLVGVGTLVLCMGTPLWLFDLSAGGEFIPTSLGAHVLGLALGLWGVRELGMNAGAWWKATLTVLALIAVSRIATPAASNVNVAFAVPPGMDRYFSSHAVYLATMVLISTVYFLGGRSGAPPHRRCRETEGGPAMKNSVAPKDLHEKILMWAAIAGIFFGLMPPYVLTIVVVATWGVPPLEPPTEQTFRAVYFLRLVLGNVIGLGVGGFLAAAATHIGLRLAGKPTYLRGAIGGAILGMLVGSITASVCPLMLLISSTNVAWAWIMIYRSFLVGGIMGFSNGLFAGLAIVYFVKRATRGPGPALSVLCQQKPAREPIVRTVANDSARIVDVPAFGEHPSRTARQ